MKAFVSGLVCLLCISFLVVALAIEGGAPVAKAASRLSHAAAAGRSSMSLEKRPSKERLETLDPFRSSKRRVPNGPDPIHNRRAGKSGRPPGRA